MIKTLISSSVDDAQSRRRMWTTLFITGTLSGLGATFLNVAFPELRLVHYPLHAAVESVGAFAAFVVAALILGLRKQGYISAVYSWVAAALIGMGFLDGLHALLHAGERFVWLHSMATLIGGLVFMFVWFAEANSEKPWVRHVPKAVLFVSVVLGVGSLLFPHLIPVMVVDGAFSPWAQATNILGGIGFLSASVYFVLRVKTDVDSNNRIIFSAHCFLFGMSAIIFEFSVIWDATWWLWHILRISAYLVAVSFYFSLARRIEGELHSLKQHLEEMVEERTANLTATQFRLKEHQKLLEQRVRNRTAELEQANADLKLTAAVVDNTSEGVVVTDRDNRIVKVNPAYCTITGYSREELIGARPSMHKSGRHDQKFYADMWNDLHEKGAWSGEIWDRRKNGSVYPRLLTINAIYDDMDEVCNYVGLFKDITDIKQAERQLETLAYFDPLTNLPNRVLYRDRLQQEISGCERSGHKLALMLIDLDRFKYVNDTLGHQAGDELLVQVAERMGERIRDSDTVARLGGDEFTIMLTDLKDLNHVGSVAQEIVEIVGKPFTIDGQEVYVGASIGISVYPDDAQDIESLNKNADLAMYRAKDSGRGQYHFFHADMDAQANNRMKMEGNLRRALINNEFAVYYQPKVDLASNTIIGMEALVRWIDPEEGIISPADFIPVAEENGMIVLIDQFVLREACMQIKEWRADGSNYRVAVNLSALQFKQSDLVEIIDGVLRSLELPSEALELEITESAIMDDPDGAIELIQGLRDLGVYLSVDDFGTGYSSLAYLKKFPINALKIDQAFVRDLTVDSDDAAIVRSVISLSDSLGLGVVAEGIETDEQRMFLLDHKCSTGQGYFFSRPVPTDEFTALLKKGLD